MSVCILVDDLEITKSGVARPKFLNSVFSTRVNYEKLTPCKYFTLLLFMLILKPQPLKLNIHQYGFENSQPKTVIKMPEFETLEEAKSYTKFSLKHSGLQCLQPGPRSSWPSFPPSAPAVSKPSRNVWIGHSQLVFSYSHRLESAASI
jgi:hypothetical protein